MISNQAFPSSILDVKGLKSKLRFEPDHIPIDVWLGRSIFLKATESWVSVKLNKQTSTRKLPKKLKI